MERKWLRAVTSVGLALAVLGGGVTVMAQSGSGSGPVASGPQGRLQAFLDDVASHLPGGITGSQLLSAVEAAEVDHVKQAVASGRLTQTQANRIEARIQSGHIMGFGRRGPAARRRGAMVRLVIRTAATYLGVSPATLRGDLRSGESLAAVVAGTGNPNLSVSGLEQAVTTAVQGRLDKAVQSGRLTAAREARILQNLRNRLDRFVNRTPGQPGVSTAPAGSGSTAGGAGSTGTGGGTGGGSSTPTGSPSAGSGSTGG